MKKKVTAIFDIGKTNKKLLLFDNELSILHQEKITFSEVQDDDGYPCDDLEKLERWIDDRIEWLCAHSDFELHKVNFSTYGASMVHLDKQGKRVVPFYNYLKPFEEKWLDAFFEHHGDPFQFSLETASPIMGFLNAGFQLFYLKHYKKNLFREIHHSLHFPQYLSYLYSGQFCTEYTSIGCHSALWDYSKQMYHSWLTEEKVKDLITLDISNSNKYTHSIIKGKLMEVGVGIHDSSAALIPYQMVSDDLYVLISTGTWNICMNPFNWEPLTDELLNKDCLNFLSPTGTQVRASRLFLGKEFDFQIEKLCKHFNCQKTVIHNMRYNSLNQIVERNKKQLLFHYELIQPEQFDFKNGKRTDLSRYRSFEEAYHNLVDELAELQVASLKLVIGQENISTIFIDGGFSDNQVFVEILADKLSEYKVYSASVPQGAAIGAALLLNRFVDKQYLQKHTIFKWIKSQVHG